MLQKTTRRVRVTFGILIIAIFGYTFFNIINRPVFIPDNNKFLKDVSYFQSDNTAVLALTWKNKIKKDTAIKKENFEIEQVTPSGKQWVKLTNPKKCTINFIQYVYAPWVDTIEKRKKASPEKRDEKITQLFVYIEPREKSGDYFKITLHDIESPTGDKMDKAEYGVVKVNDFNKFIKR